MTDALLPAVACAVIVLSIWPAGQPLQTFTVNHGGGRVTEYSLPIGDPSLTKLKRKFGDAARRLPPAKLAIARWTRELGAYYGRDCEQRQLAASLQRGGVVTVSFDDSHSGLPACRPDPASAAYWLALRDRADRTVNEIQETLASGTTSPAVVFGEVIDGGISATAWMVAVVVGWLVGCGYAIWRRGSQPLDVKSGDRRQFVRLAMASPAEGVDGTIEIPSAWVRIRQPIRVLARRLCLIGLVTGALACLLI